MPDLYRQQILDRARNPRHWGLLSSRDIRADETNVTCGDEVTIDLKFENRNSKIESSGSRNNFQLPASHFLISQAGFEGSGCIISQASTDMLLDMLTGKTIIDIMGMPDQDVLDFFDNQLTISRQSCALLPLLALRKGIAEKSASISHGSKKNKEKS